MRKAIAWLGGAVFVLSLAATAWWYFVALARPLPAAGPGALIADAALVTIFALHHSLFARERVKAALTLVPAQLVRSFYVWIASLLLLAVIALWQPVGGVVYTNPAPWSYAHALVQGFGIWLIARAVANLDPLELAGIRQAAGAPLRSQPLQVRGPYRWIRHPLYLGWMLTLFGAAHMTGDRLTFTALTSLYLILAVPWEERSLRKSFGSAYAQYAARVRWRILPYVY